MSIIKHCIKEIENITPWGNTGSGYLHWFGLTDSHYWISFGQTELLRYSDDFIKKYRMDATFPYVDYQFARIYDDFFSILDKVIVPIPFNVFSYIDNMEKFDVFRKSLSLWINNIWNEEDEQYDEIYAPARDWVHSRRLDSGYLVGAPDIYFFASDGKVYIRWYCDYKDQEGIAMWKESKGEYVMNYSIFIEEVKQSFELFWNFMDERVEEVLSNYSRDHIHIDKNLLLKNHNELKSVYQSSIKYIFSSEFASSISYKTDYWDNIENNIKLILISTK